MKSPRVNLYLVGFMGTGKSSIGRTVARKLAYRFVDSDREIEKKAGASIQEIFATLGEPAFREMERTFILSGHPPEGCVVACGGGLVVQPGMLALLREKGVVVCLEASAEVILERTLLSGKRPLLNVPDPAGRIRELKAVRDPVYRRSGTQILTDRRDQYDIANHVVRVYQRDAREWLAAQRQSRG